MSLYKDRIARGQCGGCGQPNNNGGSLCDECKEKSKQRAQAKRSVNKAANGCLDCGQPVTSGRRCDKCKLKQTESRKRTAERKKRLGICTVCPNAAKEGCTLCQSCIDKRSATSSEHYFRRKKAGLCRFCDSEPAEPGSSLCAYHREKYKDYRLDLKLEVLDAYGGPICVGCGNDDVTILEVDHIDGGGRRHRIEIGVHGGNEFYLWLKRNGFPPGFRILCPICNKKAHLATLK